MITIQQFTEIGNQLLTSPTTFLSMIEYKSAIQREIIPLLTEGEMADIASSIENKQVVNKLARLATARFRISSDDITLYCLSLSIGTIIKEYGWGNYYATSSGCYELAKMIYQEL
ncbi:hypothetical protein K0H32_07990 [Bacteroides fragilis]|nr:hypothetical protein [Bacteroides fragilis]